MLETGMGLDVLWGWYFIETKPPFGDRDEDPFFFYEFSIMDTSFKDLIDLLENGGQKCIYPPGGCGIPIAEYDKKRHHLLIDADLCGVRKHFYICNPKQLVRMIKALMKSIKNHEHFNTEDTIIEKDYTRDDVRAIRDAVKKENARYKDAWGERDYREQEVISKKGW